VKSLGLLLCTAALAIIPAYRTTPTAALLREADLPDPEALLHSIIQRSAVRYMGLDAKHLIAHIAAEVSSNRSKTRLARILHLIPGPSPERATIDIPLPPLYVTVPARASAILPVLTAWPDETSRFLISI
jgi:hypothetical protein